MYPTGYGRFICWGLITSFMLAQQHKFLQQKEALLLSLMMELVLLQAFGCVLIDSRHKLLKDSAARKPPSAPFTQLLITL